MHAHHVRETVGEVFVNVANTGTRDHALDSETRAQPAYLIFRNFSRSICVSSLPWSLDAHSAWPPSDGQQQYCPPGPGVRKHSPRPVPAPKQAMGAPDSGCASLSCLTSPFPSVNMPYPCATKSLWRLTKTGPASQSRHPQLSMPPPFPLKSVKAFAFRLSRRRFDHTHTTPSFGLVDVAPLGHCPVVTLPQCLEKLAMSRRSHLRFAAVGR